jgi:hypothetical protein
MSLITTVNDGPLIVSSTFWGSDYDRAGKVFCSVNAGCVRLLVPETQPGIISEMATAREVILSRGPWPEAGFTEAVELLFEDGTDSPYRLLLGANSFDMLPAGPPAGCDWIFAAWAGEQNRPHKALERLCRWRRVPRLPWLKPWK